MAAGRQAPSTWFHLPHAAPPLLQRFPEDFRPYLAKGLLLKDQGREGDATRYFIQVGRAETLGSTGHTWLCCASCRSLAVLPLTYRTLLL